MEREEGFRENNAHHQGNSKFNWFQPCFYRFLLLYRTSNTEVILLFSWMNYGIILKHCLLLQSAMPTLVSFTSKIPSAMQNIKFSLQLCRELHLLPLSQIISLTYGSLMVSLFCCSYRMAAATGIYSVRH